MAGRKGKKQVVKSGIDSSTMVYLSMAVVLLVLTFTLYTFGIDFGFISFGGNPNVNILYGGAAVCVFLSYICDIMYIKSIKRFYRARDNFLTYIPYVNFISIMDKKGIIASWVLVGIAAVIAIPAYTPVGQFLPTSYIYSISSTSIYVLLGTMVLFTLIRGYYSAFFKKQADKSYKAEISGDYGAGHGGFTFVSYVIYFLPIIRSISLFTDLNFINTVRRELEEMYRGEE